MAIKILNSLSSLAIKTSYTRVIISSNYKPHNDIICEFFTHNPNNINYDIVAAKLTLIDDCYTTNAFRYKKVNFKDFVNNIIKTVNIDKRIEHGDYTVVDDIVKGLSNSAFMLASAYCALHNRYVYGKDDFMIYSRTNVRLIPAYTKKYPKTTPITQMELEYFRNYKNYADYNKTIERFLDEMKIVSINRKKEFDLFLWEQR